MNLTSHERYELYKHCLSLGVPDDIAVKIRERSHTPLETFLKYRDYTIDEVADIVYGAFSWTNAPEGALFWSNFIDEFLATKESK